MSTALGVPLHVGKELTSKADKFCLGCTTSYDDSTQFKQVESLQTDLIAQVKGVVDSEQKDHAPSPHEKALKSLREMSVRNFKEALEDIENLVMRHEKQITRNARFQEKATIASR